MRDPDILHTQGGVISRVQAVAAGVSSSGISRRLAVGQWQTLAPGVFRHVAAPVTGSMKVTAAALWLGEAGTLWGEWAAWWHALRDEPDGPVTVTVPRVHNGRSREHITLRRRDLAPADIAEVRGIRVTTRPVTALENARLDRGQQTFDTALQKRVSVPDLDRSMVRLWHAYGAKAARESLALASDGTVSHPERTLRRAFREAGLDRIRAGVAVRVGNRNVWLDFAVESIKLAIEVDGYAAHTRHAVFENDRTRQNLLIRDGWTVLRYTARQVRDQLPAVVAEVRSVLQLSA